MNRFDHALPLGQSVLVVAAYLTTRLSPTAICFGASYVISMRQEVRSM